MTPERKYEFAERILMRVGANYVLLPQPEAPSGPTTCEQITMILEDMLREAAAEWVAVERCRSTPGPCTCGAHLTELGDL